MPSPTASVAKPIEIVIPDCCNMGVILRVLLAVNFAVLAAIALRFDGFKVALLGFADASILVQPACLSSLLAVCGLRKLVRTVPAWGQRAACALVPAATTALIVELIFWAGVFPPESRSVTMTRCVLTAALFGVMLQHYFELRTQAFSPALSEARLQALQARIRPHFLFNSLNAVLSLIRTEPRKAETTLEDLADLFRVLIRDARDMTTLDAELQLCRQYLSIEKIRLGERLQVQWEIVDISDDVLCKAQVPALLLQPLLENAVHYGVEPSGAPSLIRIHLNRSMDRINIAVINPFHAETGNSEGNHMALDNIRERLALLYDVEAQLTTMCSRGFFEVRLHFPYVKSP